MGCCEKTHGLVGHLVFALKVEGKGMVCELLGYTMVLAEMGHGINGLWIGDGGVSRLALMLGSVNWDFGISC
ncbi:hypothetical protein M0R45_002033 [Rubus argutus]|uniref:Uncharacterized protein n=1 Tax=Rubus argutus TaxID=59490 RepID=A0AAW1VID9_RUBAR